MRKVISYTTAADLETKLNAETNLASVEALAPATAILILRDDLPASERIAQADTTVIAPDGSRTVFSLKIENGAQSGTEKVDRYDKEGKKVT